MSSSDLIPSHPPLYRDNDTLSYVILYGNDEGTFMIGSYNLLMVSPPLSPTSLTLDYERRTSYLVVIQATDPGLLSCNEQLTVLIPSTVVVGLLSCRDASCGSCARLCRY